MTSTGLSKDIFSGGLRKQTVFCHPVEPSPQYEREHFSSSLKHSHPRFGNKRAINNNKVLNILGSDCNDPRNVSKNNWFNQSFFCKIRIAFSIWTGHLSYLVVHHRRCFSSGLSVDAGVVDGVVVTVVAACVVAFFVVVVVVVDTHGVMIDSWKWYCNYNFKISQVWWRQGQNWNITQKD